MSIRRGATHLGIVLAVGALVASACAGQPRTAATQQPQAAPAATAQPAATAAPASPAPAAASQQPLEVTGKFTLEPVRGPWDTKVTATASGLRPQARYDLVWTTGKVQWKLSEDRSRYVGREGKTIQNVLQSLTADAAGAFTATFAVPRGFGYAHDVMVVDE
jgi:hypothetical protein